MTQGLPAAIRALEGSRLSHAGKPCDWRSRTGGGLDPVGTTPRQVARPGSRRCRRGCAAPYGIGADRAHAAMARHGAIDQAMMPGRVPGERSLVDDAGKYHAGMVYGAECVVGMRRRNHAARSVVWLPDGPVAFAVRFHCALARFQLVHSHVSGTGHKHCAYGLYVHAPRATRSVLFALRFLPGGQRRAGMGDSIGHAGGTLRAPARDTRDGAAGIARGFLRGGTTGYFGVRMRRYGRMRRQRTRHTGAGYARGAG